MNITGIVAEYNPLHNGHKFHIDKSKKITKSDSVVAVISGNFVQRGEPSMVDKWTKTKMALLNGVDLVIELPVLYSISSAEFFSRGAISLLNNIGVINNICFGSEHGNIDTLLTIADILLKEPLEYKNFLKIQLKEGCTFPSARSRALEQYLNNFSNINGEGIQSLLNSPNNILGIEYCKSLLSLNSNIQPFTIKREGSNYNASYFQSKFSSATSIRNSLKEKVDFEKVGNYIPSSVYDILKEYSKEVVFNANYTNLMLKYLKFKYFTCENSLKNLPDISEGLDNRIINYLSNSSNFDTLINSIKTKRYTYTRIQRILCQYYIGFDKYKTNILRQNPCPYARILGFNKKGMEILKEMKSKSNIPIYTKLPKKMNDTLLLEVQATKAYSLINKNVSYNSDFTISPIIIN